MKKRFLIVGLLILTVVMWLVGITAVLSALQAPPQKLGDDLLYSTFLGESGPEEGRSLAFDEEGNAYIVGFTESTIFPTGTLPFNNHGVDVYVAKFNADGSAIDYIFWFNAATLFAEDYGYGIAVDGNGSAYVTGDTRSDDFCDVFGPVPGYDQQYNGNGDSFAIKINPAGSGLEYCTFLGGNDLDIGRAIIVDESGSAYVTGGTWSTDFPTTVGAFDTTHGGERDVFVVKLDPTGTNLAYATFLGADEQEEAWDIALDSDHNIFATGWTRSTNFYTTTGAFDTQHDSNNVFDGFLLKLNAAGDMLVYSTFLGGVDEDKPTAMRVDGAGHAYIAGYTKSPDFPTTVGAFDTTINGANSYDGFVLKMNPQGSDLIYSTFLGGSSEDWGWDLAVDGSGVAYVTGETWSADFPTTTLAFDKALTGDQDAFVTQLNRDGSDLLYSSYLGGSDWDHGFSIGADGLAHVYVTGETRSPDFPISPLAYDDSHNSNYDIFVTKLRVEETAIPLQSLSLVGPSEGLVSRTYLFTATVEPMLASQPITFVWQASGQPPITTTNGLSDVVGLVWETAGIYSVTVTAHNLLNSVTATQSIVVSSNVEASFTADPLTGQPPLTVFFNNQSGGDFKSVLWDFGDGFTSTDISPYHIYTDVGIYTVTLTVNGPGGMDTEIKSDYITVFPFALYLPALSRYP